jgi:thiamine transporter ThiT
MKPAAVGRWARSVALVSVAGVAYAWGASGDPAEGAAIGVLAGLLIGSFVYVEGHAEALGGGPVAQVLLEAAVAAAVIGAGGMLAAELELEPNSGARLAVIGVALVLAIVLVAWWDAAAARRRQRASE